ncbi:valine--tRNA ligase [Garciella nitratireducens]|uniref:Valine--tRNA ligase n=1 Tax=Garciella nitratireducens DSM 15102 TaxID=1121911 RepID=A0A1T4LMB4_9FIRM|nr:valine--tRNA ligase [Garciella nitratireducens]SJZ55594.1 valyl-tRNA synthetase [Garciella nitratireducens DSM 15102]
MEEGNNIAKVYNPDEVESRLYGKWEERGYFKPEVNPEGKPFTIVMPPPNITGQLHIGHAFDGTLQDILIRWKRMQGYQALWLPGTDHASIATEVKVVEAMKKEGLTKREVGRDGFLERAWNWANAYRGRITSQFRKLGASCDWSRERFTMDEGCSEAVKEVFIKLYNKGLIYRGNRIINWCPDCKTALSDAEVEYEEQHGHLWYFRYPIKDSDESIVIATTRPETIPGDSAVAVHPEDERYQRLIGKKVLLPIMNREIPIIADEYVDREFGTGVVKITPAHDPNDFEVGLRHNLPEIKVMNEDATMNEKAGKYAGLTCSKARKQIVEDFKNLGLLQKIEDHVHNVGACYRCSTTVEPITSEQWFVKMEPLAKPAIEVVREGKTRFIPERFEKIYFNWMENIKDWCISRQLWWGHRIPAYYCQECGEIIVAKEEPKKCKCGSTTFKQEEDVLDTWFSSALWPFSTLGWPEDTQDLRKHYPNDVLVTGYDIIFFWVARMIFSGIEQMGETPFRDVYIHGIVRDAQGRKMSKSLGNGVDPLEIIKDFGADALRFTLVTGNSPGNDTRWHMEKVEANRNFANKIWNAARFVLMNIEEDILQKEEQAKKYWISADKWIISRCNTLVQEVTDNLEKYELGIAAAKLYDFIWNEYCDWYIELVKPRLYGEEKESKIAAQYTLVMVLKKTLKLLHPFMPFITEEIFTHLPGEEKSIMISSWPKFEKECIYKEEEKEIEMLMSVIRSIRNARAEMNVVPSRKAKVILVAANPEVAQILNKSKVYFEKLAGASEVIVKTEKEGIPENVVSAVVDQVEIFIPLEDLIDREKEIERLQKEKENLEKELKRVNGKLSNKGFISKAPAAVVEKEREKQKKYQEMMEKVLERLSFYEK